MSSGDRFRPFRLGPSVPILAAILFTVLLSGVSSGQIPYAYLSLGSRSAEPGNNCPDTLEPCSGETWNPEFGRYEFVLSRLDWEYIGERTDSLEIRLSWPGDWHLIGYQICPPGVLLSGSPWVPGSTLRFAFPDCPGAGPFLLVWMDCPTTGRFRVTHTRVWECGYQSHTEEPFGLWVDVGERCSAMMRGHCDFFEDTGPAGSFNPGSFHVDLHHGAVWEDTLRVFGCIGPDCCTPYGGGSCLGLLQASEPWIELDYLYQSGGEGSVYVWYGVRVRGDMLTPGEHEGRIWAYSGCDCAHSSCALVTAVVRPTASVEDVTGQDRTVLGSIRPNPTTGSVRFSVDLAQPGRVRAIVVDAGGRIVAEALDRQLPSGPSTHTWDAGTPQGGGLPGGVYFLRVMSEFRSESRMFVLLR